LTRLERLELQRNRLTSLPPGLVRLRKLSYLDAEHNQVPEKHRGTALSGAMSNAQRNTNLLVCLLFLSTLHASRRATANVFERAGEYFFQVNGADGDTGAQL
jgi:Leucine-rich repeat (LRR) protein